MGIRIDALPAALAAQMDHRIPVMRSGVTNYVTVSQIFSLLSQGAPDALDTWLELVAQIEDNEDGLAALVSALAGKLDKSGGSMTGPLDMAGFNIINVGNSVGRIEDFAGLTAPSGYLVCDGAAVSRTTYARLFNYLITAPGFTSQTFTVTVASPAVFTKAAHGFLGGERLRLSTTGALPTGLNTTSDYFVIVINANTFRLATSAENAAAGTAITTTGTQSGTHSYLQSLWGLGDGSTTFNVPNLQGQHRRGASSTRKVGTYEADEVKAHTHPGKPTSAIGGASGGAVAVFSGTDTNTGSTGAAENTVKNYAVLTCIAF